MLAAVEAFYTEHNRLPVESRSRPQEEVNLAQKARYHGFLKKDEVEKRAKILQLAQELAKITMNKDDEKLTVNRDGLANDAEDAAQDDESDVDEGDTKESKPIQKSLLCQGNGCVFSRANPGTPAQAGNTTNKLYMWCDPDKLKQVQEKPTGRTPINYSLSAFARNSPDVHQQALQLLPADGVAVPNICAKANCIFSMKKPGYPAGDLRGKHLFCMWCDDERLKIAEITVIGQKKIAQSLSAFLDEPHVAAAAWAKLSAVYKDKKGCVQFSLKLLETVSAVMHEKKR